MIGRFANYLNPIYSFQRIRVQFVIDNQVLSCINKEACWTISNITAGNKGEMQSSGARRGLRRTSRGVALGKVMPKPSVMSIGIFNGVVNSNP
ncbi:hypothetical protein CMV_025530 [Castanea mollissima]|uniref:Uncharacterized protein n=1 Tax=Castanea mollissima TaxID=60419 RepID=A0A8J4Q969_9ROSI|nr:hypothetical protein CMV_025530 [Castanea mollissima]